MASTRIRRDELKADLPALYSQSDDPDPMVYKRLIAPGTKWSCYLAEASDRGNDLLLFGYFVGGQATTWFGISLSRLEEVAREAKLTIKVDKSFHPTRFSSIH